MAVLLGVPPALPPGLLQPNKSWQKLDCYRLFYESIEQKSLVAESDASSDLESTHSSEGSWTAERSAQLYSVKGWGSPYFSVSEEGRLCVKPQGGSGATIDLYEVATSLRADGLEYPMLFRFPDIVAHKLTQLQGCFDSAIVRYGYQGRYRGVFPVKCNHDRGMIRSMLRCGAAHGWGLEVGSKAELLLAMSLLAGMPGSLLVCNGYKDTQYMELVAHCWRLGLEAVVVLEQYQELGVLLGAAAKLGVLPVVGVRAKLATRHGGHWGSTSGEHAKFGLRPAEIMAVVRRLAACGMLNCLQLLHFHIGSQITNISIVKEAMSEGAYLFAELASLGAFMKIIDCGGGLGVDYDGTSTDAPASLSYTMQNYANDIVCAVRDVCAERGVAMPTIVTESGRALASHHAVMVFDVLSRPSVAAETEPEDVVGMRDHVPAAPNLPDAPQAPVLPLYKGGFLLNSFREVYKGVEATASSLCEAYSDAVHYKEEALRAFKLGVLSLGERARIDSLFEATCDRILDLAAAGQLPLPEALQPSTRPHSATYHVNLSIFRSALDTWAIGQLFPILPIHRLDEEPTVAATLADLTCDSDGKIDQFISPAGVNAAPVLPLHELPGPGSEPYLLAMFLTGAYQEVLGSAHNMFGTTHVVTLQSTPGGGFVLENILRGETAGDVLSRAQHSGTEMLQALSTAAAAAVSDGRVSAEEHAAMVQTFAQQLHSYTYLSL